MIRKVHSAIRKHSLLAPNEHVLVAVSGGADSVALLRALHELAPSLNITLTVVHLNHKLRGKAAAEDAAFVEELAGRLRIPIVLGLSDVRRLAKRKRISIEMAAREARYRFFARTAKKIGAHAVATAHTADDQAETILLKLARGAGARGLSGIPRNVVLRGLRVVRPLLNATRKDVITFLRERNAAWREDPSNKNDSFLRNRVRRHVLPMLESKLNVRVREALLRTADILREEDRWMDTLASSLLAECARGASLLASPSPRQTPRADCASFQDQPIAARRRVLRLWLTSLGIPPESIDFDTIDRIDRLARRRKGSGRIELAEKGRIEARYGELVFRRSEGDETRRPLRKTVPVPGEIVLPENGLRIVTALEPGLIRKKTKGAGSIPARASIRRAALGRKKLIVRSWLPGDRMRPLGLRGSKKVQDIFVDDKAPAAQRPNVPLFVCGKEIVWIPGYRIAAGWEVKDPSAVNLQIRVERI